MGRFRISSLFRRRRKDERKPTIELDAIERYWRDANGGDPYLALYQRVRTRSGSNDNLLKQNRFFTLWQMVNRMLAEKVPGDVAECGCWNGHSTALIADTLQAGRWEGHFWVFDSFEGGLSDKVGPDRIGRGDTTPERTLEQKLAFASRFEDVAAVLQPYPFVSLHKGWIPAVFATVPEVATKRFALVNLDVDLYEPTRDSLAFFGPRMQPGGVIVIDDYGSANFPGCRVAVDEYMARHKPSFFLESHLVGAVLVV